MADKALTESAWKAFSKSGDYKDAAFIKALAALDKAGKAGAQAELDALDEIDKQAEALRKAHKADKKLAEYLDDVEKALGKQRKASEEALAAERKAAASSGDEEEESPALLTSKMVPLIREVKKGGIVLQSLIAVAGKETVVLLSRKSISPARGKLLKEQMEKPAGIKFIRGECTLENNAITFIVQGQAAGLAKRLKAALLAQVEQRLKIRVRGEDPNDIDEEAEEDGEGKPEAQAEASPEEALKARFEARLEKMEPQIAEMLKAQKGDVSKIRAVAAFAREKGKERAWQAGLQSLDMLEKLLAAAAGTVPSQAPPEPPSTGVEPGAAFNARLAALMPKVKEALTAGGESATDIRLKVSEAGVFARKREFDKAQALLDEVEDLLEQASSSSEEESEETPEDPKAAAFRALVARLQPQIDRASGGGLAPAQREALQKVQTAWNLAQESADAGNFERGLLILQKLEAGGVLAGLVGAPGGTAPGGTAPTGDGRGRIVKQRTFMIQEWSKVPGELRTRLQGLRGLLIDSEADEDPDELVDAIQDALESLLEEIRDEMDNAINAGDPGRFAGLRKRMDSHPLMTHLASAPDFDGGALRRAVEDALDRIERGMLAN